MAAPAVLLTFSLFFSLFLSSFGAFVHPGVLMNRTQLDFIKQCVADKVEPVWTAYLNANKSSQYARSTYSPRGVPASGTIECGSFSNPDHGCSEDGSDSTAAYGQALQWYITGQKVYADTAIEILNNYATGLKQFNNSNAPLQAAWSALKIVRGAEIIRHSNAGWATSDFNAFVGMLYKVYVPRLYGGSGANGNWELSMVDALFGIAVLSDNQTLFDRAASLWRQRVPAYFYNFNIDGTKYVPAPRGYPSWYNQTVFNASTTGACQETCRDMAHTQMGINSMINAAETAYVQGLDLYSEQKERITVGMELATYILLNNTYSSMFCSGAPIAATNSYSATFEMGYSAFSTRLGMPLNNTYTHIIRRVRNIVNQVNTLTNAYETLTHSTLAGYDSSTSTSTTRSATATTSNPTTAKPSTSGSTPSNSGSSTSASGSSTSGSGTSASNSGTSASNSGTSAANSGTSASTTSPAPGATTGQTNNNHAEKLTCGLLVLIGLVALLV